MKQDVQKAKEREIKYQKLDRLLALYGNDTIGRNDFWTQMNYNKLTQEDIDWFLDEYRERSGEKS